jgi:hypothetical protein
MLIESSIQGFPGDGNDGIVASNVVYKLSFFLEKALLSSLFTNNAIEEVNINSAKTTARR